MFGFGERRRKRQFEAALAEMPLAAQRLAEKWVYFERTLKFNDDVPLLKQIQSFSFPASEFVRTAYPNISTTIPAVYLSTLLLGVHLSKTHPIPDLLAVAGEMEQDLEIPGLQQMLKGFIDSTPNR